MYMYMKDTYKGQSNFKYTGEMIGLQYLIFKQFLGKKTTPSYERFTYTYNLNSYCQSSSIYIYIFRFSKLYLKLGESVYIYEIYIYMPAMKYT